MAKKQNQQDIQRPAQAAKVENKVAVEPKNGMSLQMKLAILLGIISCVLYFNTLNHGYVLDDFTVIKNNAIITKGVKSIPEVFSTPYRRGWFISDNDLYRPLSLAMFAVEWDLGSGSPMPGHLMNILFFAGAVMLLFFFFDELFERKRTAVAFIAALLFALHPIHTEVVANIKSRDELLCFFFAFLSLNVFLKYLKNGKMTTLLLGALCFFLSCLSKETVISFIGIIPFIFFFYRNEDTRKSLYITISTVVVAGIFLLIRYQVLHAYHADKVSHVAFMDNMLTNVPAGMSGLATEILILGKYVKLLFIPHPLIDDYTFNSIPFTTFGNILVILSLLVYVGMGGFAVYRLLKDRRDPYAFAILFFLATIALFSNIPFLIGAPMAERFAFFASAGFCLVIALLIETFLMKGDASIAGLKKTPVMAVLLPVCIAYGALTIGRNQDWLDNLTLFRADVANAPNDARLNYYLGTQLVTETAQSEGNPVVKRQLIDEGMEHLRNALAIYPLYDDAHAALGDAYFKIGQNDSAEVHDKRALELNPKFIVAMNNLAGVYFVKGQIDTAIAYCRKSLVQSPNYVNTYANLGLCYMRLKMFDSSLTNLYKGIAIEPKYLSSYDNIVLTFNAMGKADSARKYAAIAKELREN